MSDQASNLRVQVSRNKLEQVIDSAKNLSDISDVYNEIPAARKNRILFFISSKGGTGKTSIIESLVYLLSSLNKEVAVLDLNKDYSDINTYIDGSRIVTIRTEDLDLNNELSSAGKENLNIFKLTGMDYRLDPGLIRSVILKINLLEFDFILIDSPILGAEEIVNFFKYSSMNILVTTFAEMKGQIYSMELHYGKNKVITPNLEPSVMNIDIDYVNKLLGMDFKEKDIKKYLERMGYAYKNKKVYVPESISEG